MTMETVAGPPAPATQRLLYDGRLGELYRIFLENLLLGIVTLGIYRFWGRTRYRRYLWSHTTFSGDRFEYTGTGGELFRGFVIAILIFLPALWGVGFLEAVLLPDQWGLYLAIALPVYGGLVLLFFASHYTALRYRLTRTRWRGIRGGLDGSAINYALRNLGYFLLNLLTLTQFTPFATVRLWRYRLNNLFFGTARAEFEGRGRDIYPSYLKSFLVSIFGGLLVGLMVGIVIAGATHGIAALEESPSHETPLQFFSIWHWAIVGAILGWWIVGIIAFLWYQAFAFRYIVGRFKLAGISAEATVSAGKLFRLVVGNLLLLLLTLGICYPVVLHRIWRFGAANLLIHGEIDGAVIAQSRLQAPRLGEGWLEVLDPGII